MTAKITRRKALKIGTSAAVTAAIAPRVSSSAHPDSPNPDDSLTAGSAPSATPDPDICFLSARRWRISFVRKKLSAREVMQAHLKQIERMNPKVNAIVTLVPEDQLMAQALAADEAAAKAISRGHCTAFLSA